MRLRDPRSHLENQVDGERWLPVLNTPGGSFDTVVDHLERSRTERLVSDFLPSAWKAQRLRHGRNLAAIARIARAALADRNAVIVG